MALADAYFDGLDHGLILLDHSGHVALCTAKARRALGLPGQDGDVGCTAWDLLRRAHLGTTESRRSIVGRLREPLRQRLPVRLDLVIDGRGLSLSFRPLPAAGWAVSIAPSMPTAKGDGAAPGFRDALTGLPNRAFLGLRLQEATARLAHTGEGFALLSVDLDRFKQVNDTLGHPIGDALLVKVAERLLTIVRATDSVARLGGDEFAVLQPTTSGGADTAALAARIVDLLGRAYVIDGHLINIGASVGVATAPRDGVASDAIVRNSDLALYRAKTDGRDMFRFYEAEMGLRMEARRLLELDLRKALAMREFELVYQPQLNLETNRLVGCEALIRWNHPTRGLVSPGEFIPLAEEIGLIVPIGEWVIRTACKEAVRWPGDTTVAVNLSPIQFRSKKLVETVVSALAASGLPPSRLELEITEGVLLQESDVNLRTLHALRDFGLRISMDDFGTGYSSLSYLRSFPFDKIKIDRSFVSGGTTTSDSAAIVRAIASLGASFGMTTVAEGVETADQMQRIRAEGCNDIQGYWISRPVSADEVFKVLGNFNQSLFPELSPTASLR